MSSFFVLASLLDTNFAEIFQSPFIVPCFGTMMILGIVVAGIWSGVRTREMQSQERLAAIAKGIPMPPAFEAAPRRSTLGNSGNSGPYPAGDLFSHTPRDAKSRQGGIVLVCIGFAMVAFFVFLSAILHVREILIPAAAGLFPFAIGVGLLIDARIRSAEIARRSGWTQTPGYPPAAAPDPVAGSAAASDWNPPLH